MGSMIIVFRIQQDPTPFWPNLLAENLEGFSTQTLSPKPTNNEKLPNEYAWVESFGVSFSRSEQRVGNSFIVANEKISRKFRSDPSAVAILNVFQFHWHCALILMQHEFL